MYSLPFTHLIACFPVRVLKKQPTQRPEEGLSTSLFPSNFTTLLLCRQLALIHKEVVVLTVQNGFLGVRTTLTSQILFLSQQFLYLFFFQTHFPGFVNSSFPFSSAILPSKDKFNSSSAYSMSTYSPRKLQLCNTNIHKQS